MLAVHLLGAGLSTARTYVLGIAGQRFVADLRVRLHAKLMRQSTAYLQDRRSGDLIARVIGDVDTLQDVVLNGVDSVIGNALSLIWVAGIIVWLNWKVGSLTLAQVNEMLQRAMAAAGRVFDVLDAPETVSDAPDAVALDRVEGHLRLEGVGFAYVPERPILHQVDFEARPGQQVGIVGPSGSGKSTVLGLLLRFFDPQTGHVVERGTHAELLARGEWYARTCTLQLEGGGTGEPLAEDSPRS